MEGMPGGVEVRHDRLEPPVAEAVDDVSPVAVLEQLRVVLRTLRPGARPGPDADLALVLVTLVRDPLAVLAARVAHAVRDPHTSSTRSAAADARAAARASSRSEPRASVTATRRRPATDGLPNSRRSVPGRSSAASTPWNTGTPWPAASTAQDAAGPSCRTEGMGRPSTARACSANSLRSCETRVTRPVSCGRGETSENSTSSPRPHDTGPVSN